MHLLPGGGVPRVHRAQSPLLSGFPISPFPGQCINLQPWLRALTHRVAPLMRGRPGCRRCRARATGLSPVGPPWAGAEVPSLGAGAWRNAPLLPWRLQCPGRVCAALPAGSGGLGPVPGVVSSPFPPARRAFPAPCVAGHPFWVSLMLARWYAIPCGPYWRRMLDLMTVGRVQLPDGPIYVPEDAGTAIQAPEWASFISIVDGSLNPVPLCDLDQVLLKEVMAKNRGLTLSDLKNRSPEHLSGTLTGCESLDGYLEPAAVQEDADAQLSKIASTIPPVDPSCVDLKQGAFLAQLLLEEVDLESTSEPASPVEKPVQHMQPMHKGEPVARSPDALARPACNNMPLS